MEKQTDKYYLSNRYPLIRMFCKLFDENERRVIINKLKEAERPLVYTAKEYGISFEMARQVKSYYSMRA